MSYDPMSPDAIRPEQAFGHMTSGATDGTLNFESELSRLLGVTAAVALKERP